MSGIEFDVSQLAEFAARLKAGIPGERSAYRKGMRDIGKTIADSAKEKIANVSPETAASIKVGTRGADTVIIRAGGGRVISKLLEGDGYPGKWRHPLFGDKEHWYDEERHPYLWPAWKEHEDEVTEALGEYIAAAIRESIGDDGE